MGKRDTGTIFEKKPRDLYPTIDPVAARTLAPYLGDYTAAEPCYGNGDLVRTLADEGYDRFVFTSDINPDSRASLILDGRSLTKDHLKKVGVIVTNPPYTWSILKDLMDTWLTLKPTWLLLPADYMHNKRMGPYMQNCHTILSIGRMYWEDNKVKGVDNYAWYGFSTKPCLTEFVNRYHG